MPAECDGESGLARLFLLLLCRRQRIGRNHTVRGGVRTERLAG